MNFSKVADRQTIFNLVATLRAGSTVAITGSGGGLVEPDEILAIFEECFLQTGAPKDLTLVHALGLGDGDRRGTNRFAYPGMVKRVIGGHWTWSPRMLDLVRKDQIEAYALPSGVIAHLFREIGAGRPGLITKVGLGTFVDPRYGGGKSSPSTTEDLVELTSFDGQEYLRYRPFPIDVGVVRGTYADEFGNIYTSEEAADLDGYEIALAAANTGGIVIAQVRDTRSSSELRAHEVLIPGQLVDHILPNPKQAQSYLGGYHPSLAGICFSESSLPTESSAVDDPVRRIVAKRAAMELKPGSILNFGFGMSADVSAEISRRGSVDEYWITVEQGLHNGTFLNGNNFGMALNPSAIVSSANQFDFYSGGGLDQTFLGMGEFDQFGNVNVSHLGDRLSGPGGFIDISQGARHVIFCGRFNSNGTKVEVRNQEIRILNDGAIPKVVENVMAITFSGREAIGRGQRVTYVTERAVFELRPDGVELVEYAPGLALERDVLARMGFKPIVKSPIRMSGSCFAASTETRELA